MIPKNRVPTHPEEILLEEFLQPLGVSQVRFARHLRVPLQRVNEIVRGKRGVTPETAWLLAQALGTTPEFWVSLQGLHDLAARRPIGPLGSWPPCDGPADERGPTAPGVRRGLHTPRGYGISVPKTRVPVLADPYRDRLLARLRRVEGQVRGIQKMVDEGRDCVEILEQLAAANQALRATAQDVLRNYLRTCATNAIRSGSDAEAERVYGELTENFFKFAR